MGVITDSPRPIEGYLKLVAGGDLVAIAKAHHPFEEKGLKWICRKER
jgi:hypothetical protein